MTSLQMDFIRRMLRKLFSLDRVLTAHTATCNSIYRLASIVLVVLTAGEQYLQDLDIFFFFLGGGKFRNIPFTKGP